jgi:hypothetical protein
MSTRDTTAGWKVDESGISVTSPLGEICDMSGGRDEATFELEEMEAHARLIAAAPTLLATTRLVKHFLLKLEEALPGDPLADLRKRLHGPLHEKLDAAIAKAEGRV